MYCSKCGTYHESAANFCSKCGSPLGSQANTAENNPYYQNDASDGNQAYTSPISLHPESVSYAGFWKRVGASLLDGVIIGLPSGIFLYILFGDNEAATNLVSFIVGILYKTLMESSAKQATVGKMIVGIKVTDLNGQRISFGRAIGRYFASILSSLTLGIGYLLAGWTEKKQTLHDMVAGTLVVDK
jgi:uncharacterized RDD family membrane protein YckC